ncbi:multiple inositol polyphosphate phosphatase 1-like [Palaemon carinicauda]|uniref:multiple inositol polyphosphate phosphatase 1-like n=1 Tax=Palaemon carinicauda TaxID=392227 RepID=UPI0035B58AF2
MEAALLLRTFICLSVWLIGISADEPYCLAEELTPYVKFSSKTPYRFARGAFNTTALVPQGCEAKQVWHISRHGTRYAGFSDLKDFVNKLPKLQWLIIKANETGKGELCAQDASNLEGWSLGALNVTWASILAPEGERELRELAVRYKSSLPDLLDYPFSNESFKFRYTDSQRTEASARAYAEGLFGDAGSTIYMPKPLDPDPLIKFYDLCSKYIKEVDDNPEASIEATIFREGPEMAMVIQEVSRRLGINTTFGDVETMYDACRYYKAWDPVALSPWCAAFTPENLKVLEYWQDLLYYYEDGYGHAINYESACPPIQDLVQHFRKFVETEQGPRGIFYFTHSGALNKIVARLGLYEDSVPLAHDNLDPDRLWRTSNNGPFATNIAFTLSKCEDERGWWVSTLLNEEAVKLPGCLSKEGCSWQDFYTFYGQYEFCDFDAICENGKDSPQGPNEMSYFWDLIAKEIRQFWEDFWFSLDH